jgi:Na+-translocating ferredoxin:NAD+ oxidoreductase RnfG subunit
VLPYIEEIGLPKEHGVNWINMELMSTSNVVDLKVGQCCWGTGNECSAIHVLTNGSTNMDYCYYHYKLTAKKMLMAQKLKQKLELKALIAQAKAEEKQKKLDAKNEAKAAKALGKKGPVVVNTGENVVLSASLCQAILKSGPRKGQPCGGAVKLNNCCTRHGKAVEVM